jgi:hypothetical protein
LTEQLRSAAVRLWGILWGPRFNFSFGAAATALGLLIELIQQLNRPPLGLIANRAVVLQHFPAEMAAQRP